MRLFPISVVGAALTSIVHLAASVAWAQPPSIPAGGAEANEEASPPTLPLVATPTGPGSEEAEKENLPADDKVIDVTITAQRSRRDVFQTSRAVTVMSGESVVREAPPTLPEALRFQPGVALQRTTPGQGSLYLRGMTGREVLHLVDGVRLNNALFRSGPNQYLALVDGYNVHRVEVVRGSSSVLYGSDALGGVVQVVTPLPQYRQIGRASQHGHALQNVASNGLSTISRVAFDHGARKWALRVGFTVSRMGDVRPGEGTRSPVPSSYVGLERDPGAVYAPELADEQRGTSYRMYAADVAARAKLSRSAELILRSQTTHQPSVNRYNRIVPRFKRAFPTHADEYTFSPNQRLMNSAQLSIRPEEGFVSSTDVILSWQRVRDDVVFRRLDERCVEGGVETSTPIDLCGGRIRLVGDSVRTHEKNRSDALGVSAQVTSRSDDRTRELILGGDAYFDLVTSSAFNETIPDQARLAAPSRYPDGSTMSTFGLFGQGEIEMLRTLRGIVGARASLFDIDVKERVTPGQVSTEGFSKTFLDATFSGGLRWEFVPGAAWVANVGRGVRAPSIDDFANFGSREGNRFEIPNEDIRPEHTWSFDGGVKLHRGQWRGEAYIFHTRYSDKIVLAPTTISGQAITSTGEQYFHSTNASKVEVTGTEIALRFPIVTGLGLFGNFLGMRGVQTNPEGLTLPEQTAADRIPPATLASGIWAHPAPGVRAELFAWTRAAQTRLNPVNVADPRIPEGGTDGFTTLHLRSSWMITRFLTGHLAVDNITNRLVLEHGSGAYSPGINVIGTLELRAE